MGLSILAKNILEKEEILPEETRSFSQLSYEL